MPKRALLLAFPLLMGTTLPVPQADDFCRWESNGQYHRMERAIKQQIAQIKRGERVSNGHGDTYITHNYTLLHVEAWLNDMPCAEAILDKCVSKIDLFPGHAALGAKYAHGAEICYNIQLGKVNRINRWLGWLHYFKDSNKLHYQGATECPGFVEQNRAYCQEWDQEHAPQPHNE
jgi:hypothetical protein